MESKGHRKVSDSDMDNIKRATEHRLRFKKQGDMNNTKQLPQELVQKMSLEILQIITEDHAFPLAERCAQIAVDYAEEEKVELIESQFFRIKQQLEHFSSKRSEYGVGHEMYYRYDGICACLWEELGEYEKLLKKHEDGCR